MSVASTPQVLESVVRYQALGKLAELATEIAGVRRLKSAEGKALLKQAAMIRLWLKALDYGTYLTKEQRDKIKYALVHIAEINAYGTAPTLNTLERPDILIGGGGNTIINNNTYSGGTPVSNTDIDTGTENVDSFATSLGVGCIWHYTASKGTAYRTGIFTATWNTTTADGAETSTPDVGGSTDDLVLSVDLSAGTVRFRATAASDNWSVTATRYLITV